MEGTTNLQFAVCRERYGKISFLIVLIIITQLIREVMEILESFGVQSDAKCGQNTSKNVNMS